MQRPDLDEVVRGRRCVFKPRPRYLSITYLRSCEVTEGRGAAARALRGGAGQSHLCLLCLPNPSTGRRLTQNQRTMPFVASNCPTRVRVPAGSCRSAGGKWMPNTLSKRWSPKLASSKVVHKNVARPAATCSAFRDEAASIIFGDRSIADR